MKVWVCVCQHLFVCMCVCQHLFMCMCVTMCMCVFFLTHSDTCWLTHSTTYYLPLSYPSLLSFSLILSFPTLLPPYYYLSFLLPSLTHTHTHSLTFSLFILQMIRTLLLSSCCSPRPPLHSWTLSSSTGIRCAVLCLWCLCGVCGVWCEWNVGCVGLWYEVAVLYSAVLCYAMLCVSLFTVNCLSN